MACTNVWDLCQRRRKPRWVLRGRSSLRICLQIEARDTDLSGYMGWIPFMGGFGIGRFDSLMTVRVVDGAQRVIRGTV